MTPVFRIVSNIEIKIIAVITPLIAIALYVIFSFDLPIQNVFYLEKGTICYQNAEYGEAMEWFLKAAEAGYTDAMMLIGRMYEDGLGVEQDYDKAMEWYANADEADY